MEKYDEYRTSLSDVTADIERYLHQPCKTELYDWLTAAASLVLMLVFTVANTFIQFLHNSY